MQTPPPNGRLADGDPAVPTRQGPPSGAGLRILVAEDNETNSYAITLMLRRLGCQCDVVPDGRQAVEAVVAGEYDLVLMDVNMPHVDGVEATRQIRQRLPTGPRIVAVTASATRETRTACFEAGMDDFLSKPVIMAELATALSDAGHCPGATT